MTIIRLGLIGGSGKMGQAIARHTENSANQKGDKNFIVSASINSGGDFSGLRGCDVIVDFSKPQGTSNLLLQLLGEGNEALQKPMVVGTTGLDETHKQMIQEISKIVPVVYARNTSLGIAVMQKALRQITSSLGEDFDIEILESHHRHKDDSPSGTSLMLGETIADARSVDLGDVACFSRVGKNVGPRKQGEIGFAVIRGGSIPGQHTVSFISDQECLQISHTSFSRDLFVKGALVAAGWVLNQPPGLYNMEDVLQ